MFYILSKVLDVLLSPLSWALIGLALTLRWRKEPPRWRKSLGYGVLFLLVLASNGVLSSCLWRSLEKSAVDSIRSNPADPSYDAVILLGGVVDESAMHRSDDAPAYNDNVERLLETFELLRSNQARVVVISGGRRDSTGQNPVESRVIALQLQRWGIAQERIIEDDAMNTRENAEHALRLAQQHHWHRVIAVTSAFHSRRARGCFHAVGLETDWKFVDHRAYDNTRVSGSWLPRADALRVTDAALREMAGWWVYRLRGWVRE